MHSLPELQKRFGAALRDGPTRDLWALFCEPPVVAERRLAAYRRNAIGNWRNALASTYPVLAQLLGPQRFRELADRYIAVCPSRSGDLNVYGGDMAALLEASAPSEELPYLPDVARLEWALMLAYGAADAPALDLAALAAVPADARPALRFPLWAGVALIGSRWPLADIWCAHQLAPDRRDSALASLDVSPRLSGAYCALVVRIDGSVSALALSAGEAAFLSALHSGQVLAQAIALAMHDDLAFNPGAALQRFVALRVLAGFEENENE